MEKAEYLEIKKQLSFEKPLWITLAVVVVDLVLLAIALYLLTMGTVFTFLLSQALLALFYFHSFAMLHEAGHGNLHRTRWVNTALGHYFSIFCFIPYFAWKHIHQGHHMWSGTIDKDPGVRILEKIKKRGKISPVSSLAWRLWLPLPAAAQHLVFWSYPWRILKEGKKNSKSIFYQGFCSEVFIMCTYVAFYHVFPQWVTFHNLGLSIFLYCLLTEVINLPHHTKVPYFYSTPELDKLHPWQQHTTTRSCHYPSILGELIALNFNLHIEHHFFPNLPWYRLKSARDLIKPQLGGEYMEVNDLIWNWEIRRLNMEDVVLPDIPHPYLQNR